MKKKPQFSQNLFLDIDVNTLDFKENFPFILGRVLDYGLWSDWNELIECYTKEEIQKTALILRTLSPKSLSFISVYIQKPINEFRCYKNKQSFHKLLNS